MNVTLMAYGGVSYALNISKMRYDLGEVNARRGDSSTVSRFNSNIFKTTTFAITCMTREDNVRFVGYLTMCKYDIVGNVGYIIMCKDDIIRFMGYLTL